MTERPNDSVASLRTVLCAPGHWSGAGSPRGPAVSEGGCKQSDPLFTWDSEERTWPAGRSEPPIQAGLDASGLAPIRATSHPCRPRWGEVGLDPVSGEAEPGGRIPASQTRLSACQLPDARTVPGGPRDGLGE